VDAPPRAGSPPRMQPAAVLGVRTGRLDRACLIGGTTSRTTRTSTKLEYWTRQLPACAKRWGANGLSHEMCVVAMRAMSAMAQDAPRHEACWQTERAATFMATARAPNNRQSDEREVHVAEEVSIQLEQPRNTKDPTVVSQFLGYKAPSLGPSPEVCICSLSPRLHALNAATRPPKRCLPTPADSSTTARGAESVSSR
jgi:hypothetical protein